MRNLFQFGEQIEGYSVAVLNERAVRASAGILFLFAIVSFMHAWLQGNFQPTRMFVVAFVLDFTIRLLINPRYAPSLIIGQWITRKQQPEYVGAPQKRFAWAIGFTLALAMLYLVVIKQVIGPVNLFICLACLTLLFFESVFGICLGCKVYNLFYPQQAQHCPGNNCETTPANYSKTSPAQLVVIAIFAALVSAYGVSQHKSPARTDPAATIPAAIDTAEAERCKVPDFAKAMGHEEVWKLHNNCK